jgi:DUF1680 family protein
MQEGLTRRELMKRAAAGAASGALAFAGAAAAPAAHSVIEPFDYTGVKLLDGPLRKQFDYAREFYRDIPDDNLLKGFRQRAGLPAPGKELVGWYGGNTAWHRQAWWSKGDTFNAFGQYLSGMARLAKAGNDQVLLGKASSLMREWAKTIEPDGFFFYSRQPYTAHYIYEKTMYGLVDLFQYGGLKDAAPLMERITAWAVKNLDRSRKNPLVDGVGFGADGQEWYTLSENLYRAFLLTGDKRYREFGDLWWYPRYWGMFTSGQAPTPFGCHAYSHVNTLSSAAMTYAVTGDPQYLKTIVNAYDWFERTQFYATGGFGPNEQLMAPDGSLGNSLNFAANTFETVCGSWAGFKLSRYLMRFTGDARYGDWIEKLVYNGIGAALPIQPDGRNYYYSDYRVNGGRKLYHQEWNWSCCSGTYPQTIADYHNVIYFRDAAGLYVNLYVPSEVTWSRQGGEVRVRQETRYPEEDTSVLTVQTAAPARFALKFRVPGWSRGVELEVNGKSFPVEAKPRTWAVVERTWQAGDRVKIRIPMQAAFAPIDSQHPNRVALTYGPVVLVRREPRLAAPGRDPSGWVARTGRGLEFQAERQGPGVFVPLSAIGLNESYCMYFDIPA